MTYILKYILDKDKNVIPSNDVVGWGKWFETADRRVARTVLNNGKLVSTVFMGLDHNFCGEGPPLVFETMVFPYIPWWKTYLVRWFPRLAVRQGWSKWGDLDCERTASWSEAEVAHGKMCIKWR